MDLRFRQEYPIINDPYFKILRFFFKFLPSFGLLCLLTYFTQRYLPSVFVSDPARYLETFLTTQHPSRTMLIDFIFSNRFL